VRLREDDLARVDVGVQESLMTATVTGLGWRELSALAKRLCYRPGWTFNVGCGLVGGSPQPALLVAVETMDSRQPDRTFTLWHNGDVPPCAGEDEFFDFVLRVIDETDAHEAREWLTVDGVRRWDPHAKRGDPAATGEDQSKRAPVTAPDTGRPAATGSTS
jgi:hypothetical protein